MFWASSGSTKSKSKDANTWPKVKVNAHVNASVNGTSQAYSVITLPSSRITRCNNNNRIEKRDNC